MFMDSDFEVKLAYGVELQWLGGGVCSLGAERFIGILLRRRLLHRE